MHLWLFAICSKEGMMWATNSVSEPLSYHDSHKDDKVLYFFAMQRIVHCSMLLPFLHPDTHVVASKSGHKQQGDKAITGHNQ